MIDRYAQDALARYGRVRQLDPAAARAELEHFDQLLRTSRRFWGRRRNLGFRSG